MGGAGLGVDDLEWSRRLGGPGGGRETGPVLHNLTVHVAPDRLDEVRSFYTETLGLVSMFEDAG